MWFAGQLPAQASIEGLLKSLCREGKVPRSRWILFGCKQKAGEYISCFYKHLVLDLNSKAGRDNQHIF